MSILKIAALYCLAYPRAKVVNEYVIAGQGNGELTQTLGEPH